MPAVPKRSPLDDPRNAAHAFRRFKRLMRLMMAITAIVVIAAMGLIYLQNGRAPIHVYIAMALGVSFTMLLTGALMGLMFLSSGTGHDESVAAESQPDEADDQGSDGRRR